MVVQQKQRTSAMELAQRLERRQHDYAFAGSLLVVGFLVFIHFVYAAAECRTILTGIITAQFAVIKLLLVGEYFFRLRPRGGEALLRIRKRITFVIIYDLIAVAYLIPLYRLYEIVPFMNIIAAVYFFVNLFYLNNKLIFYFSYVYAAAGGIFIWYYDLPWLSYLFGFFMFLAFTQWLRVFSLSYYSLQAREEHNLLLKRMLSHNINNKLMYFSLTGHCKRSDRLMDMCCQHVRKGRAEIMDELRFFAITQETIPLRRFVNSVLEQSAEELQIEIPDDITVQTYPYFLAFVISNLYENAMETYRRRKYTERGFLVRWDNRLVLQDFAGGLKGTPALGKTEKQDQLGGHGQALYLILSTCEIYGMSISYEVDQEQGSTAFSIAFHS